MNTIPVPIQTAKKIGTLLMILIFALSSCTNSGLGTHKPEQLGKSSESNTEETEDIRATADYCVEKDTIALYPIAIGDKNHDPYSLLENEALRWGFINKNGEVVASPQFDGVGVFSEGLAKVMLGDKIGFIDKTGKYVVNPQFDDANDFSEGLAGVKIGDKCGFVDRKGTYVVNPQFDGASGFSEGLARVWVGDKCGFIDKTGVFVVNPQFDDASDFSEGLAMAEVGDKCGFIDKTGVYVVNPHFDDASDFSDGLAMVEFGGKCGFIDKTGKYVVNPQFDEASDFCEGLAKVRVGGKTGFIDKTGKYVINPQFDGAGDFSEGLAMVRVGGKCGFIDKTGKFVVSPQFDGAESFSESLAAIVMNGNYGCINQIGEIVIKTEYDYAVTSNDLVFVVNDGYFSWIDKEGKPIWQEQQWITHDKLDCVDLDLNSFDESAISCYSQSRLPKEYEWLKGRWAGEDDGYFAKMIITDTYYQITTSSRNDVNDKVEEQRKQEYKIEKRFNVFLEQDVFGIDEWIEVDVEHRGLWVILGQYGPYLSLEKIEKSGQTTSQSITGFNEEVYQTKVIADNVAPEIEEEEVVVVEQEIFQIVEEMPSFPGGDMKLMEHIAKNIKYPQIARESGIQGRVFIGFVVEPDGSISNVKLLRGIGGGCDEEAVRVIKGLPKWKPGKQRGKAVRVSYQIPVNFKL